MSEVGRPLKFKTVKELEDKIQEYFDSCFKEEWFEEFRRDEETGHWITEEVKGKKQKKVFYVKKLVQIEEFTITGLAIFLDTSRETLLDYQHRDEYSDTIKKAKLMIEKSYEQRLINRGNSGDIFALKNFNWKDKTEQDITTGGKEINAINYIVPNGTDNKTNEETTRSISSSE